MAFGDEHGNPLIRYVTKNLSDGWLAVRPEHGANISLPSFLKVAVCRKDPDRSYFTILEGLNKGVKASVAHITGKTFLVETGIYASVGSVRLNRTQQHLWYGSKGPCFAFSGAYANYTAIPRGKYNLRIPDAPHKSNGYSAYTAFQNTWFPIIGNGVVAEDGRYLHIGELSDGCVAVRAFVFDPKNPPPGPIFQDWANLPPNVLGGWGLPYPTSPLAPLASWTDIYKYLINSRLDDLSVGTLVVE